MLLGEPVDRGRPLDTLIPRSSLRKKLYRLRGALERENGRPSTSGAAAAAGPTDRAGWLHADLTILARLACALTKARVMPLAT